MINASYITHNAILLANRGAVGFVPHFISIKESDAVTLQSWSLSSCVWVVLFFKANSKSLSLLMFEWVFFSR